MAFLDAVAGPMLFGIFSIGILILLAAIAALVVVTMIIVAFVQRFREKKKNETEE